MKTTREKVFTAILALALATGVAFADPPPTHVYVEIKGMACPFCVQGVEKHLKKLDGVEGVTTSLEKSQAVLHLKPGAIVTEEQVRAAVKDAGFTAGKIRIEKGGAAGAGEAKQ